ncbi:MAG TPA: 50S ribosomal protein L23 [Candidatus Dojkabacteria bacterium]|jgi:large subunit ribosomal protein L23|uniref:Large ribosomal subunit protein uL23 n=1 Tax=Candidatus Dojkabacteria bacterium TaxID=2099670 RepID=A0A847D0V4_9BACT|nr:50S ribosomal protein L23 [Candidatus Dojkabacteria bacterium]HPR91673.1 50S ribosomal protein L23 [Candidatus Dojkabacteria bacterium]
MRNKTIELQPMVSEKSYAMANANNKYTFLVERYNNKIEVAKAVESKYKVKVESVNSVVKPGKMKRDLKTYKPRRERDMVKVIVTLKKGDKINEFLKI